jgi:serine/threonine protein phosphatase PrpC
MIDSNLGHGIDQGVFVDEAEFVEHAYISIQKKRIGRKEDCFLTLSENIPRLKAGSKGFLYAVMDGIGGHKGGYQAASFLQQKIPEYFSSSLIKPGPESIRQLLHEAHEQFKTRTAPTGDIPESAGSTLSLVLLYGKKYFLFHTGDSRIYLLRRNQQELIQLTKDHQDDRGVLTRFFGHSALLIDELEIEQVESDIVIIATDGLNEKMGNLLISENVLEKRDQGVDKIVGKLATEARARGSTDDLTIIAFELLDLV